MASTAAPSAPSLSPRPIQRAHASAVDPLDDAAVALDALDFVAERDEVVGLGAGLVAEAGAFQEGVHEGAGVAGGDLPEVRVAAERAGGEAHPRLAFDVGGEDEGEVVLVLADDGFGAVVPGGDGVADLAHAASLLLV